MRRVLPLFALLPVAVAAQVSVSGGGPRTAPTDPNRIMPAGQIFVDTTKFWARRSGHSTERYRVECVGTEFNCGNAGPGIAPNRYPADPQPGPGYANYNTGSFRISCAFSHVAFDDPIVWPNQPGRTHGHMFFGNTKTNYQANFADFATVGNSTCDGGTLNRSGYWVPFLVYHCPAGSMDGCNPARDGEPIFSHSALFYYKCGAGYTSTSVHDNCNNVNLPPVGFRMITGNASNNAAEFGNSNPAMQAGGIECYHNGQIANNNNGNTRFKHMPTLAVVNTYSPPGCNTLNFLIPFPNCWDGVNLDSPSHISHVTDHAYYAGCTNPAFPNRIPDINLNIKFSINEADLPYLRLTSDQPKATATGTCNTASQAYCAGATLHADWVNGWSQRTDLPGFGGLKFMELLHRECHFKGSTRFGGNGHTDCHANSLGNLDPIGAPDQWWRIF